MEHSSFKEKLYILVDILKITMETNNNELKKVCMKIFDEYVKSFPYQLDRLDYLKQLYNCTSLIINGQDVTLDDVKGLIGNEKITDDVFIVSEDLFVKFFKYYHEYVADHKKEFIEDCISIHSQVNAENVSFDVIFLNLVVRVYVRFMK